MSNCGTRKMKAGGKVKAPKKPAKSAKGTKSTRHRCSD